MLHRFHKGMGLLVCFTDFDLEELLHHHPSLQPWVKQNVSEGELFSKHKGPLDLTFDCLEGSLDTILNGHLFLFVHVVKPAGAIECRNQFAWHSSDKSPHL